jgi:hypothetical protein
VPQPPGTATAIIAPPVSSSPTPVPTAVEPTKPPVPTPTQAGVPPTPTARSTTAPIPVPTEAATLEPTEAPPEEVPTEEPTEVVPGVPGTGGHLDPPANVQKPTKQQAVAPAAPVKPQPAAVAPSAASLVFRVFYDRNGDAAYARNEGIRGMKVYFVNKDAGPATTGELLTSQDGIGQLSLPLFAQRIYIPYLGINMDLTDFPQRELHSLWLNPVKLPDTVP